MNIKSRFFVFGLLILFSMPSKAAETIWADWKTLRGTWGSAEFEFKCHNRDFDIGYQHFKVNKGITGAISFYGLDDSANWQDIPVDEVMDGGLNFSKQGLISLNTLGEVIVATQDYISLKDQVETDTKTINDAASQAYDEQKQKLVNEREAELAACKSKPATKEEIARARKKLGRDVEVGRQELQLPIDEDFLQHVIQTERCEVPQAEVWRLGFQSHFDKPKRKEVPGIQIVVDHQPLLMDVQLNFKDQRMSATARGTTLYRVSVKSSHYKVQKGILTEFPTLFEICESDE